MTLALTLKHRALTITITITITLTLTLTLTHLYPEGCLTFVDTMSPKSKAAHVKKAHRGQLIAAIEPSTRREIYRIEGQPCSCLLSLALSLCVDSN